MHPPKINLLDPDASGRKRRRFSFWKGTLTILGVVAVLVPVLVSLASVRLIRAASNLNPDAATEDVSLFEQVRRLVGTSEKRLRGEDRDRVNILVLGEGGEGHEGPHLTDTILFVTFQPSTSRLAILSLPRDLWVPLPDQNYSTKINTANALAEMRKPGSGGAYAAKTIGLVLGQPIDYYLRVDFSAFETLIDDLGGVAINVDQAFTDYSYPTSNNLYQTVRFAQGWQTMDGETALQYVRSRHGNNGEGSDFARSRRQQKVLLALKDKLVSLETLLNPSRIASVLETLESHVITDMELWETVKLAKAVRQIDRAELIHHVLDNGEGGPLYATSIPLDGIDAYVLLPKKSDWSEVRALAADILRVGAPAENQTETASEPATPASIEVRNGTRQAGLARKTQDLLEKSGYRVVKIGNHSEQDQQKTVVYDLTNGGRPEALKRLQNLLGADVALTVPGYLSSGLTPSNLALTNGEQPKSERGVDFLVVLGTTGA